MVSAFVTTKQRYRKSVTILWEVYSNSLHDSLETPPRNITKEDYKTPSRQIQRQINSDLNSHLQPWHTTKLKINAQVRKKVHYAVYSNKKSFVPGKTNSIHITNAKTMFSLLSPIMKDTAVLVNK